MLFTHQGMKQHHRQWLQPETAFSTVSLRSSWCLINYKWCELKRNQPPLQQQPASPTVHTVFPATTAPTDAFIRLHPNHKVIPFCASWKLLFNLMLIFFHTAVGRSFHLGPHSASITSVWCTFRWEPMEDNVDNVDVNEDILLKRIPAGFNLLIRIVLWNMSQE